MELVFLSNGQACYLKEKIGDKFIVNKIFEYQDDENGWQEVCDTNDIVVDAIFISAPIEKIDSEMKELKAKKKRTINEISELERQKQLIKNEVDHINKTQISKSKFIINRSDLLGAKTLALFPKDRPLPFVLNSNEMDFRGLELSLNIKISDGKERSWGYKMYNDRNSYGDYLCEKYGILINPTQEEIDSVIIKRLLEFKFTDYWITNVDDKYLTEDLLLKKQEIIKVENQKKVEALQKTLIETQQKLSSMLQL